jgi:hypothetical protein
VKKNSENQKASLWSLLRKVHRDDAGAVSIETVLIIAAVALPILIFIIKYGWPQVRSLFQRGMEDLEGGAVEAQGV